VQVQLQARTRVTELRCTGTVFCEIALPFPC